MQLTLLVLLHASMMPQDGQGMCRLYMRSQNHFPSFQCSTTIFFNTLWPDILNIPATILTTATRLLKKQDCEEHRENWTGDQIVKDLFKTLFITTMCLFNLERVCPSVMKIYSSGSQDGCSTARILNGAWCRYIPSGKYKIKKVYIFGTIVW
jgi:hypothetical protein